MIWLVLLIPVVVFGFMLYNKIYVDFGSFFRRSLPLDMGIFGVYCFVGKQGSGKTYALVKYIHKHAADKTIYSNLTLHGVEYKRLESVTHLLSLRNEKNVIIVYDEILNLLNDKSIPRDIRDELMEFLSQQRKMKNILLTTSQEWLNVPIEFRRFVRIIVDCKTRPLGRWGGILQEEYSDGYEITWSNIENEYVAPRISQKYSKYERRFMLLYDTYERIHRLRR